MVEAFFPPDVETASPEEISDYLYGLEEQIQTVGQMTQMQQLERRY